VGRVLKHEKGMHASWTQDGIQGQIQGCQVIPQGGLSANPKDKRQGTGEKCKKLAESLIFRSFVKGRVRIMYSVQRLGPF